MFDTILDDPREWWGCDLYDPTQDWPVGDDESALARWENCIS